MGDAGETQAHAEGTSTNGVSGSIDDARAAFMARGVDEKPAAPVADTKAKAAIAEDDSDLEDDGELDAAGEDDDADLEVDEEQQAAASDDDSDLDEDEDEDVDDTDTKKRIASVRRTDQRLREQRERQWKERDAEYAARETKLAEREAKASKLEKLVERLKNPYEVADVLAELGHSEDDFEATSQATFARSKKFASDPKAKEHVAKLKAERDKDARLAKLEQRETEREQAERERAEMAAAEQRIVTFIGATVKATTEKTPLAAALIEKNPGRAQNLIAEITARHLDEHGAMPTSKQVIIALEKSRRQDLRDLGVDPKSITTVAAAKKQTASATDDKTKTAPKKIEKATKTDPAKPADVTRSQAKDAFINRKFD